MKDFYGKIAEILDVDEIKPSAVLADFPEWDSLAVLSVIAMLDANYGVNLTAMEIRNLKTAEEIANAVARRKNK